MTHRNNTSLLPADSSRARRYDVTIYDTASPANAFHISAFSGTSYLSRSRRPDSFTSWTEFLSLVGDLQDRADCSLVGRHPKRSGVGVRLVVAQFHAREPAASDIRYFGTSCRRWCVCWSSQCSRAQCPLSQARAVLHAHIHWIPSAEVELSASRILDRP